MKRLLVVDDSMLVREKIISILEDGGYSVKSANNGNEALTLLNEYNFDLIITDIIMPKMEGLEFITYIKKKFPDLKILAISSYKPFYLEMAKEIGANETCEKRHVPEQLLYITRNLLQN